MLIIAVGLVMFLFAVILATLATLAIATKKQESRRPWAALAALVLGLLALVLGLFVIGQTVSCISGDVRRDRLTPVGLLELSREPGLPTCRVRQK